jgi:DNA-binding LytR/AlgR family response regulator
MKTLKILILEDELLVAIDIKKSLLNAGHKTPVICRTISEAQNALDSEEFDLAILDIILEEEEFGIKIAEEINAKYKIPFIFLTGHSKDDLFKMARKTSPAAFLIKPFRAKELDYQIQIAYENHENKNTNRIDKEKFVFLPTSIGLKKINMEEVMLLEANKSSTFVYLHNQSTPELFSVHLGYLSQFFETSYFFQISRSSVVNMNFIDRIETNEVYLTQLSKKVKLSDSKRSSFLRSLTIIRRPK